MKQTLKVLILFAALLGFWTPTAFADPAPDDQVGLKLEVNKRQLEVGDSLTVSLEFRRIGSGGTMVSESPSIPTLEKFDIHGRSSSTRVMMVNGRMSEISTTNIHLTATQPGDVTLGPALVIVEDPQLGRRELKSNTVVVTVTPHKSFSLFHKKPAAPPSAAAAPAAAQPPDDLHDIRGLLPMPSFPWIFLILPAVLLALGMALYRYLHRKSPRTKAEPAKGPAEQLRARYRVLEGEEMPGDEFCRGASALARACLQYRYGFAAEDRTSFEVSAELKRLKASESVREATEKCLRTCDRVLYAEGTLSATQRDSVRQALSGLLPKGN